MRADQGEELRARSGVAAELAVQCGGDRTGARCSYAAYGHAQMLGFHDDTQTARRNLILEPVGDLLRQPFLHLGAAGEHLDHPGEFGQPENPFAGQVTDVGHADDGQHVMLTNRPNRKS